SSEVTPSNPQWRFGTIRTAPGKAAAGANGSGPSPASADPSGSSWGRGRRGRGSWAWISGGGSLAVSLRCGRGTRWVVPPQHRPGRRPGPSWIGQPGRGDCGEFGQSREPPVTQPADLGWLLRVRKFSPRAFATQIRSPFAVESDRAAHSAGRPRTDTAVA